MVYFWKRGECMKHLLVVEDEFDIQELLQNYLEHAGYQVSVAEDGVQALELFHKGSYDLVPVSYTHLSSSHQVYTTKSLISLENSPRSFQIKLIIDKISVCEIM